LEDRSWSFSSDFSRCIEIVSIFWSSLCRMEFWALAFSVCQFRTSSAWLRGFILPSARTSWLTTWGFEEILLTGSVFLSRGGKSSLEAVLNIMHGIGEAWETGEGLKKLNPSKVLDSSCCKISRHLKNFQSRSGSRWFLIPIQGPLSRPNLLCCEGGGLQESSGSLSSSSSSSSSLESSVCLQQSQSESHRSGLASQMKCPFTLSVKRGFPSGKTPASGIFLSLVTGEIISDWKMEELELGVSSGALKMVFTVPSVDLLKVASVSFTGFWFICNFS